MHFSILALTVLASLTNTAISKVFDPSQGKKCADIHFIVARASTEAPGAGIIGNLTLNMEIRTGIYYTVSNTSVDYPASLDNYAASSAQGTAAMTQLLINQVAACPTQAIVLTGYSQGAHVVGDTLAGGGFSPAFTTGVNSTIMSHVKAAVLMGDPRHMPAQYENVNFQAGTSFNTSYQGYFPRPANQLLNSTDLAKANRIHSYCDLYDPYCTLMGSDYTAHHLYVYKYNQTATDFIVAKLLS